MGFWVNLMRTGEYLDEDMDFTFEDFKIPEEFKMLEGMI